MWPSTAWTAGATRASSVGACSLMIALAPLRSVTCASDTENARVTAPAVAVTGTDKWLALGVPGLNGFIGEFMIITGTFASDKLGHVAGIQSVGAALGVILAALYMLTAVQKMFFGPITRDENKRLKDINSREIVAVAAGSTHTLGLRPDGTVVAAGNNQNHQCEIAGWDAIRSPN